MENLDSYIEKFEDELPGEDVSIESHEQDEDKESEYTQRYTIIHEANKKIYIVLIKQADSLFKLRKYEEAIPLYKEASDLIPKYPYPKNKIVEIGSRLKRKKSTKENKKALRSAIKKLEKEVKNTEDELSL